MYGPRDAVALAMSTVLVGGFFGASVGIVYASTPGVDLQPKRTATLRLCSANIQNTPDLPDRAVRADVRTAGKSCDVVLWQEIGEKADYAAVIEELGRGWRTSRPETRPSPISWRTARLQLSAKVREVRVSDPTPRCANRRPSYNPARHITSAPLQLRSTGQRLTAISLHFPQRKGCRRQNLADRWQQAYQTTKANLPAGSLVIGGDWNRREREIPPMTSWHWTTAAPNSLDHIAIARTGWQVRGKFTRDLNSDHALTGCVAVV